MSKIRLTFKAIILLGAVSITVTDVSAKCFNVDDNTHPCRYKRGDAWCTENTTLSYAYNNNCLKNHSSPFSNNQEQANRLKEPGTEKSKGEQPNTSSNTIPINESFPKPVPPATKKQPSLQSQQASSVSITTPAATDSDEEQSKKNANADWRTEFLSPEMIREWDESREVLVAQDDPRFKIFLSNHGLSPDKIPKSGFSTLLDIYRNRDTRTKEYVERLINLGIQYRDTERLRTYHLKLYNELETTWKSGTVEQGEDVLVRIAGTIGAPGKDWNVMAGIPLTCSKRGTPAERIAELRAGSENMKTNDLSNGGVEVGYYDRDGVYFYRTYFPSNEECIANLPENLPIPDKYK